MNVVVSIGIVLGILLLVVMIVILMVYVRVKQLEKAQYDDVTRFKFISWLLSWATPLLFNMSVKVEGLDYLETVEKGVLFGNHQSNFDIVALLKGIKRPHGYVAKKELDNIFILSDAMRLIRCEFMDRNDVRQSVKVISRASKTVESGHLMVIFPEGTREKLAPLGQFKAGSFKLAQKAKADIVPVTIFNSYEVSKRFPRHTTINIKIHQPIAYEAYENKSMTEICTEVEQIVKQPLLD